MLEVLKGLRKMSIDRRSFIGSAIALCAVPGVSVFGKPVELQPQEAAFNAELNIYCRYNCKMSEFMLYRNIFNAKIGDEILLCQCPDLVIPGEFNISEEASFVIKEMTEATMFVALEDGVHKVFFFGDHSEEFFSKNNIVPFSERKAVIELCFQGKTITKYKNTGRVLQIKL